MLSFLEDYPRLEPAQKEQFQRTLTRLLSGEVLTPGSPMKPDLDWRFAERYHELIDSYLVIGGWRFDIDLGLRMARAVHETGSQRVKFNKLESLLLCALRLHYHEQMRTAAEDDRCDITAGDLRERLVHAGKPANQLSSSVLAPAVRRLSRHSLVRVERGFEARDDEPIEVLPLIEKVLPPDRIHEMQERISTYLASRNANGDGTADTTDGSEYEAEEEAPETS